jgi:peptidyl-prolyl cis-trans isomerase B (cyclophilin B)
VSQRRFELWLPVLVLAAAAFLAGCGGGEDDEEKGGGEAAGARDGGDTAGSGRCERADRPRPRRVRDRRPPSLRLSPQKTYTATVVTSCGTFKVELDSKQAPRTGGSFVALARDGFYDGLSFHRIARGFVIQGGDPRGDGSGGPGYSVRERPPDDVVYSEGVVAMAKTEADPPGTSGSQFFVVTSPSAPLEPIYALLGEVTDGLDVVHRIERVPAGPDEQPVDPVRIERIDVEVE